MNRKDPWPFIIIGVLLAFFLFLEVRRTCYFLNDDNRAYFLPAFVHNAKALADGELAFYNFHQHLGLPHLANAQSAVLYPPCYIAALISYTVWGNGLGIIDLLVVGHLLAASLGVYAFMRRFHLERSACAYVAFAWPLCGVCMASSSSWWIVSVCACFFPWTLYWDWRIFRYPTRRAVIGLTTLRLLFLLSGHIQYFAYACLAESIFILLLFLVGKGTFKTFINLAISFILFLIAAFPFLWCHWLYVSHSAARSTKLPYGQFVGNHIDLLLWLKGLFMPFFDYQAIYSLPEPYWFTRLIPFISHIGWLTLIFLGLTCYWLIHSRTRQKKNLPPRAGDNFFLTYYAYLMRKIPKTFAREKTHSDSCEGFAKIFSQEKVSTRSSRIMLVFLLTAGISLIWAFGWFCPLFYHLPVLNRLRWPHKILMFANFFLIASSAWGWHLYCKFLGHRKRPYAKFWTLAAGVVLFMIPYLIYQKPISFNYREHISEPSTDSPLTKLCASGRIVTMGRSENDPYSHLFLGFNYATLLNLYQLGGHEPLLSQERRKLCLNLNHYSGLHSLPLAHLRKCGVKYYLVPKDGVSATDVTTFFRKNGFKEIYSSEKVDVFEDLQAPDLAFLRNGTVESIKIGVNDISIDADAKKDDLLSLLFYRDPDMTITLDGKETKPLPHGMIALPLPLGHHTISVRYTKDRFALLSLIGLSLLLGSLFVFHDRSSRKTRST